MNYATTDGAAMALLEHLWGCRPRGEVSFEEFETADRLEHAGLIRITAKRDTHWEAAITERGLVTREEWNV